MDNLKKDILSCLKDLKGSGKFISTGTAPFQFPGLQVDGVGEISYPVNEVQAKTLIKAAHKAPFGKGSETIYDDQVRSTWEIDAAKLTFNENSWSAFLKKTLSSIKQDMGLEDYTISAHLYKLLIYEKGGFFLPHKDSEKEKGMFGTLVIGLPSRYTGGELEVSFDGVTEIADFAQTSGEYKISYAAFYADCDHEVKPLTSGYRVCLVYNLVQQKSGKKIKLTRAAIHVEKLAEILRTQRQEGNTKPHIILLGHQYTPENFSTDSLKLNDRPKAEALLRAARTAGCYAKFCLVTAYLSGMPMNDGSYYDYDDDDDDHYEYDGYGEGDENAEMEEVYDEELSVEHWLESDIPALSNVDFQENDLIASFALKEGAPIVKELSGYMGNYGPDLEHWYHYGAVMIWSPEANMKLLPHQDAESKLKWIRYFNENQALASEGEISAISAILSEGMNDRSGSDLDYGAIADWVINTKDKTFFLRLNEPLSQFYFTKIDAGLWLKLADFFTPAITEKIFSHLTQNVTVPVVEQLLAVLRTLSATGKSKSVITAQMKKLPDYLNTLAIKSAKEQFPVAGAALRDLLWMEKRIPQQKPWISRVTELLTAHADRKQLNKVLAPQLLAWEERTKLAGQLLGACRKHLQRRADNQPQPPNDWSRQVPQSTRDKKQWKLLKPFLESPDVKVFDFRARQSERDDMENAIKHVVVDLKTETIKKGSPYTLRITKTQAAYHKAMSDWKEDVELLNQIVDKMKK